MIINYTTKTDLLLVFRAPNPFLLGWFFSQPLTTVTERTAEIGLKKALGALPWQIQVQFLMESFMLSMIGGLFGILLGLSLSYALCSMMDMTFALSAGAIALGAGFSAAVGILFGWAPARKASRLNPIDALRSM